MMELIAEVILYGGAAVSLCSAVFTVYMARRWMLLMEVIDLLCLDIWRARDWPLRHIVRDDVPPPRMVRRPRQ